MDPYLNIGGRRVEPGGRAYIVAEMSANHGQEFSRAEAIVRAAKDAGADAIKLQTYTPDTLTLHCDREPFKIRGTAWDGSTLYDLYAKAYTPWEWHAPLQALARGLGLDFFSTAFDDTAVEFLERLQVPVHKVASFENVDLPLLRRIARTGKPVLLSTGLATREELEEAKQTIQDAGGRQLAFLKCTSAYPASPADANLRTIPDLAKSFGIPVGLSDHTLELAVPVAAVALGACVIEKHLTLSRAIPTPDSGFSLEPVEFRAMVDAIRVAEQALGTVQFGPSKSEEPSRVFRRSLFVVKPVKAGECFTAQNVRSIRPGHGLPPRELERILGRRAAYDLEAGTPMSWDLIADEATAETRHANGPS